MKEFIEKLNEKLTYLLNNFGEHCEEWGSDKEGDCHRKSCSDCVLTHAIEIVNRFAEEYELLEKFEKVDAAKNATTTGWIPVSEGLPEEHESVFAKFKGTDKWNSAMYERVSDTVCVTVVDENGNATTTYAHTADGNWLCNLLNYNELCQVTAWQPLPEPYQPNGE